MSIRLAGPARVAIAAGSIVLGAAACGSDEPAADRTDPLVDTSTPPTVAGVDSTTSGATRGESATTTSGGTRDTPTTTTALPAPDTMTSGDVTADSTATTVVVSEPGVNEADVIELEQQLDEIDRVLADLEAQLEQD